MECSITTLHPSILSEIIEKLAPADIARLGGACKTLHSQLEDHPLLDLTRRSFEPLASKLETIIDAMARIRPTHDGNLISGTNLRVKPSRHGKEANTHVSTPVGKFVFKIVCERCRMYSIVRTKRRDAASIWPTGEDQFVCVYRRDLPRETVNYLMGAMRMAGIPVARGRRDLIV